MNLEIREIGLPEAQEKTAHEKEFYLFYSTYLGGFTRDRLLMTIPIDDHIFHRGDGVFDDALCINGNYYLLNEHIDRFFFSANAIRITIPFSRVELKRLLIKLGILSGKKDFLARFFLSRGHGSMSVFPHEVNSPNLYVLIDRVPPLQDRYYSEGMTAVTSPTPMRPPVSPQVKSVDYLSNALMELSARNSGADAAIALDASGNITEGSNKNVAIVDGDGVFRFPPPEKILRGTTLMRALELVENLRKKGIITDIRSGDIPIIEAYNAKEILLFSTSLFVAPVVKYDGQIVGDGKPGSVWKSLYQLFEKDVKPNKKSSVFRGRGVLTPLR
ncbi:MAG: aminotransferase class IV [Bacteroidetes bacterium]|nr:aminotransferase class IV [Bacteroidota bacterium]